MAIQYYMNYTIFFQDPSEYQFALAVAGGSLLELAPRDAASLFGVPYPYPSGDMSSIPRGIYFYYPFTPGSQFFFPNASGLFVDDTVLSTTVPGQAGNPSSIWPAGPDGIFTWSGNIAFNPGAAQNVPVPNAIPQRRWVGGRELSGLLEGGTLISALNLSRDFSRTIDGVGLGIRGNSLSASWNRTVAELRTGLTTRVSWERFYARFRRLPTVTNTGFWRCHGTPSNAAGCGLKLTTSGTINAYDINAGSTESDKGVVFTPNLNEWYRFDVLLKYGSGASPGIIVIYINGIFALTYSDASSFGMGANTAHTNSDLGQWTTSDAECEIDLDDWINSDLPGNCDPVTLGFIDNNFPIDWFMGSHVRVQFTDIPSQTNWSPANAAKGTQNQNPSPETRLGTSELTSTTSGAILEGLTDALPQSVPDSLANVLGAVASIISIWSKTSDGSDGTLGYSLAGGAAVLTTINQLTTEGRNIVGYLPTGMILPTEIYPWVTVHVKAANTATDTTYMMLSVVEYIGVWGPEDDPLFEFPINRLTFIHNCRYGNTMWGYLGSQPAAPVFAVGGTYTGNASYQEVTLPGPCHFLWIRGTTVGAGGIKFFGASYGAHIGARDRVIPNVRMWFDFTAQAFKFSVTGGASSECNASGVVYQYIAFCDPGMRFNLCGAFAHGATSATPKINPLIDSSFLAEAGFFQTELAGTVSNNPGLYFRGVGSTGNNGTPLTGAAIVSTIANFEAGLINSFSTLHFASSGSPNYSLWRTQDSGGACSGVMVQLTSYVGNGSNPRNIPLTPTSGRFPLFVMVTPVSTSGSAIMRDPSHTGSNSCNVDSLANSTTGITAVAVDQITVSSSLNSNNVTYSVFVICGDSAGMNNGTFIGDYCEGGGPYEPPLPPQGNINVLANGGVDLNGAPPLTLLRDVSGIYTLVTGKRNDTLIDRQAGQPSIDVKIPDPVFKTGYVGG